RLERFERELKSLSDEEPLIIPTWFSADTSTGSLAIHLSNPHCFSCEIYETDAGFEISSDEEAVINLGEEVLKGLFYRWFERIYRDDLGPEKDSDPAAEGNSSSSSSSSIRNGRVQLMTS